MMERVPLILYYTFACTKVKIPNLLNHSLFSLIGSFRVLVVKIHHAHGASLFDKEPLVDALDVIVVSAGEHLSYWVWFEVSLLMLD